MGDSGTNDKKIRCVKVTRPLMDDGRASVTYRLESFSASDEFDGAEFGDVIKLELLEMTEEAFDALPEFEGW